MKEAQQQNRANMMLNEPLPRVITKMSVPSIISFIITSVYNLADTDFVSFLGTNATAAVSVNASLDQIIMMAGSMLAIGANSYIARLLGAGQREKANRVLSFAFFSAFLFGAVVLAGGMAFMTPMVRLLGATPSCEQYSIEYATYVLLVAPIMASSFVMNQCLRAEGSAMLSMIGMGFGGILNCILDPFFIFGLDLGVTGASMATAISKIVSFVILLWPYISGRSMLKISIKNCLPDSDIVKQVVSVGSSSLFRNGLAVVSAILLNNIAGAISDSCLAGIGVTTRIMMFPFGIILGFGTGFQPVAGFNWGAKNYQRVRGSFRFSAWTATIGGGVMALLIAIFAEPLIRLFAETDPEMQAIGALCIRLQCIALPVHSWVAVVNMFCNGLGYAKGAVILATARQGSCFLPVLYPLAYFFGASGVAAVQGVADVLTLVLAIPLLKVVMGKVTKAEAVLAAEQAAETAKTAVTEG